MPGEFELIRRYFTPPLSSLPAAVLTGVGDDCAVLRLPPACDLALSVDTQVAGVHFHHDAEPALIASRALRCAASDLVATGAEPLGFTLALTLPAADEGWLQAFADGLQQTAAQLHCPLVGGDTTRGPLTISVQVHGSIPYDKALRRSGARAGDQVWVSGTLGDGAAALAVMEHRLLVTDEVRGYLLQRFYRPDIDFALGVHLRQLASSAIDVSDGLVADLGHICQASGVGARIRLDALPVSPLWRQVAGEQQALSWTLGGGDDYRLCFTMPARQVATLQGWPGLACIGHIVEGQGVSVVDADGVSCDTEHHSYRHF